MPPKLYPQTVVIAQHLLDKGSITPVEAAAVYRVRALPRRIADLKENGWPIKRELKTDATGQRYARYYLNPEDFDRLST